MSTLIALTFFSALSFVFFGLGCFVSPHMKTEFIRYQLPKYRNSVGALQLFGAFGLILGYYYSPLLSIVAAIGLALLMLLGLGVRLKIKDSFLQSTPAFFYALINIYIAFVQFTNL